MNARSIRNPHSAIRNRSGVVLLAVLVVLVLLTLAAYQYAELMTAEYKAVDSYRRSAQARAFADSGIHYVAAMLANPGSFSGNPFDDGQAFAGILIQPGDHPRFQGRFSVLSPLGPDESSSTGQGYRFGVTDECGKINPNTLFALDSSGKIGHDLLMGLPNMTEDVANAILDWIDPDDTPRANGAENQVYSTLEKPYRCKNGPLDSFEELLLVRGVTPQLLFGNDRNRNGTLEADEDEGQGGLDRGWSAYLTIHSRELNVDSEGNPRIYANDQDLNALYQKLVPALGTDLAVYVMAYRLYGPAKSSASSGSSGKSGSSDEGASGQLSRNMLNFKTSKGRSIASLYELLNSSVSIPNADPKLPPTRYVSPLNDPGAQRQLLPKLLDKVTTVRDAELPGRINVNTAPRAVLAALPGLSDADVQNILGRRSADWSTNPVYQTPAWLLTEANLRPDTLRTLERYITARTQVYRVQVLGYFDGGGPTARLEAVIDTNNGKPRIVYWRDLTELGKGFDMTGNK